MKIHIIFRLLAILMISIYFSFSQPVNYLPLFYLNQLHYEGAIRLPDDEFGISSLNYSEGPIEYNPDNHSLFIVGHAHHQAITEFHLPPLVESSDLNELNFADSIIQEFTQVLNRTPDGNPQNIDRIGGMEYVSGTDGNALIVNGYEYYDAPGDNTMTTLILENADDLENSSVSGYLTFDGGAGHTSGWISPVPSIWQDTLGGNYITGQSSGIPIISRTSVGPSAFAFQMDSLLNSTSGIVNTSTLLDFSLQNPLHDDLSNNSLQNDLWTHLTRATYGFIVPGTRTYFTIGYSGGHGSGVCYKCTQDDGTLCGGYCAPEADDYDQYYWLWDMNDLLSVLSGETDPHNVLPYDFGPFHTPFENSTKQIGGGSFDPETGMLYLSIQKADRDQGTYSNPPVIVVYSIKPKDDPDLKLEQESISLYFEADENICKIRGLLDQYIIEILEADENIFHSYSDSPEFIDLSLSDLPSGLFFIRLQHKTNPDLMVQKILKN